MQGTLDNGAGEKSPPATHITVIESLETRTSSVCSASYIVTSILTYCLSKLIKTLTRDTFVKLC